MEAKVLSFMPMRQLITRVDDDLHARLRLRAIQEGRSVNALVNDILAAEVSRGDPRSALRMRARASGRLVVPPAPARTPSRDAVARATRVAGTAASEALLLDRADR
jgi:plasmid stability protein